MHINQLVDILKFIDSVFDKNQIVEKYKNLFVLCSNRNISSNSDLQDQLLDAKKSLFDVLVNVNPKSWTDAQYRIFIKFGHSDIIGEEAVLKLQKIFDSNENNFLQIKAEIEIILNAIYSIQQSLSQLKSGLEPLVKASPKGLGGELELEERHHLLYIQFDEGIFIKDIGQLEKFCRIWNRILASFAYLTKEAAEDIRIYDIESSSITFYTGIKTINALTKGTYQVLKGYKKVLEIRKLQLELDGLNLSNKDELKSMLEEEVVNIVDVISGSVTNELLNKYGWNGTFEQDEVYKTVQISLKQSINFVEKGGKIDSNHAGELRQINEKIISILKNISDMEAGKIASDVNGINISVEADLNI